MLPRWAQARFQSKCLEPAKRGKKPELFSIANAFLLNLSIAVFLDSSQPFIQRAFITCLTPFPVKNIIAATLNVRQEASTFLRGPSLRFRVLQGPILQGGKHHGPRTPESVLRPYVRVASRHISSRGYDTIC